MRAEFLALLTAAAWGVGGFLEKRGLHDGSLSPLVGITIRTAVALLVLGAFSAPQWRTIPSAGVKPLALLVVGGGFLAGSVGMLSFYAALKAAPLSRVMPLAFTSPLFGALLGFLWGGEPMSFRVVAGMALTVGGIALIGTR